MVHKSDWLVGALLVVLLRVPLASAADTDAQLPDSPSASWSRRWESAQSGSSEPGADSGSAPSPQPDNNRLAKVVKRGLKDQEDIYRAPFRRSALKWDLGFSLVTAALIATDPQASKALPLEHRNVSIAISDVGLYGTTGTLAALYLSSFATHNAHTRETGVLGVESLLNAMALYAVIQVATGRERPLEGSGNGRFWQNNSTGSSFPSGHGIATWAVASVVAREYPHPWVQYLAYGTATAVSVTRFTGAQHFPSDIFVSSTLGYFIGRHIFSAHCRAGLSSACKAK